MSKQIICIGGHRKVTQLLCYCRDIQNFFIGYSLLLMHKNQRGRPSWRRAKWSVNSQQNKKTFWDKRTMQKVSKHAIIVRKFSQSTMPII